MQLVRYLEYEIEQKKESNKSHTDKQITIPFTLHNLLCKVKRQQKTKTIQTILI